MSLAIFGAGLLVSGAIVGHALIVAYRTPPVPDPGAVEQVARAAALTFDEHAAVAAALLQPDQPIVTADQQEVLLHADRVGDEAEQFLRNLHDNRES